MRIVKWSFLGLSALLLFAVLHYTLPQRDVVRVTGAEVIRMDFTRWNRIFYAQADSGNTENTTRDIRLINTAYPKGGVMVFRNEDTGFGWPWYFKFDSSNLQAEAADLISSRENPQWVVITHYGWRWEFLSIYPNAVSIRPVDSPDVTIFPWINILILAVLGLLVLGFYRLVQRFKRRKIDPLIEQAEEHWDSVEAKAAEAGDNIDAAQGRFRRLFKRWFG